MTKVKVKLPEMGQWPDKLVPLAFAAALILTTGGFLLAFTWLPPVNGASVNGAEMIGGQMVASKLLLSQKIFYFHMAVAATSMVVMLFMAYYSVRYLQTKEKRFDTCAKTAMGIALVFVLCTMLTGEMWTRFEWGVWWTWEPRLTTYLVLTIMVIAYFVLRNSVDNPERRGVYAAVVGIISFIDVPITLMVTRIIPSSLHPVVFREGGMTTEMGVVVMICLVGMLSLAFVMYRLRFRAYRLEERTEELLEQMED